MLEIVVISVVAVGLAGLILGAMIGFTAKKFGVPADPEVEAVQALLPGANCGGCGFAGCMDMASAIVHQGVPPSRCPVSGEEQIKAISALLGIEAEPGTKMVAVVSCGGSLSRAARKAQYNGVMDCRSAQMAGGGGKACRYGCIGYGTCARTCPFGAIEIRDGLAVVHPELCRGCGKCESVCPRKLIRLVPADAKVHVYCNSLDKPAVRRKNCSVACIACRKCLRTDAEKMQIHDQFVRVNYNNPPDPEFVDRVKCPTGALQTEEAHRRILPREEAAK